MAEETILGGAGAETVPEGAVQEQTVTPEAGAKPVVAAPAASAAPAFDHVVGADGAFSENWRDSLPEDIRNEPSLGSIKCFQALAKSYVHAQRAVGANKIAIPGSNATDDEKNDFYKALGRPEDAEKYEFKRPEDLPENIQFDESAMKGFREEAFKMGLSQEQYNAAIGFQAKFVAQQQQRAEETADAEYASTMSKLKGEYGGNFDSVVAQCNKAVDTFGLKNALTQHGLLNNYDIIKALANIGGKISESKLRDDPDSAVRGDPASRLAEIQGNPKDPYNLSDHPLHKQRVSEVAELVRQVSRLQQNKSVVVSNGGNN